MNELLQIILKKMYEMVGAVFTMRDCRKKTWFQKYWWTEKEEEKYKKFLLKMLIKNKGFRQIFLDHFIGKDTKIFNKAIDWFCFSYGWTTLLLQTDKESKITGYYYDDIKHVLSNKDLKSFNNFTRGQSVIKLNNKQLIYEWDFDKWKHTLINRKRK